jgi:hypothetical protein
MASYLGDVGSDLWAVALTQANVTATVTGAVADMITGDGRCGLVLGTSAGNLTYLVANILQSTQSTGGFVAITGATIAATTAGVVTKVFLRDSQFLCVRYDFAGTGVTGINGFLTESKKLTNG